MSDEADYGFCDTMTYRYDGANAYFYRYYDGLAWDTSPAKYSLFYYFWISLSVPKPLVEIEKIVAQNASCDVDLVRAAARALIEVGLLIPRPDERRDSSRYLTVLPSTSSQSIELAAWFHLATARLQKLDYRTGEGVRADEAMMEFNFRNEPIPPNYHRALRSDPSLELSTDVPLGHFECQVDGSTAFARRVPNISRPINLDKINFLINCSVAQTGTVNMLVTGEHIRKPVPSGGARHPVEVYIVVNDDDLDIERGVYHYNVQHHRLDILDLKRSAVEQLFSLCCILPRARKALKGIGVILTCRFARSMHRYHEPRSYRVMHFDVGHILANLSIGSRLLGLRFSASYSLPESMVESLLLLDPLEESVMAGFVIFSSEGRDDV
ncbi:SagB/ThcOx family dehydrogenase [Methylosinus sp. H3A]|uniref:SagB/ThcOx family dehydrogenase n=1 Tax=Methylosinus sp. H3A TaxID=2785786 RepID=UPI0018C25C73|nr:SagB/ThcOx family dehydrogenase [Methylosinus sp. H3A]MBG0807920.1 SagB/ThcOx family dehydrogenase [Methylosinus sp. H3A]